MRRQRSVSRWEIQISPETDDEPTMFMGPIFTEKHAKKILAEQERLHPRRVRLIKL